MRRFLLHILPPDFHRIRYFGLSAGPRRRSNLAHYRQLLDMPQPTASDPQPGDYREEFAALTGGSLLVCPRCRSDRMLLLETIPRDGSPSPLQDTS